MSRRALVPVIAMAALVGALAAAGCDDDRAPGPHELRPAWHEVTLPAPPGPTGRPAVRDATACDGTWYVVGAVLGDGGASRPAAWRSDHGRQWQSVPIQPEEYWARRAILTSVACRDGVLAAVGAKSGGAHGNPRTSSWFQRPDGTLVDMRAGFELYGGPAAVSVNRIAAGPDGWLIGGNRRSGAAVWLSADATDFRLLDDDPALSSDAGHQTVALDQVHDGSGWTTVGRAAVPDRVGPVPLAWTSPDGTAWTREEVPAGTEDFADLERVVRAGSDLLAVGIRGDRFGVWRRTAGRWRATDSFGRLAAHVTGAPFVSGLVASRERAVVAVTDGADFRLWADTGDGWTPVRTPMRPANTGDDQLSVAADGSSVLLLADDGRAGRVWLTSWAELSR